MRRPWVTLPAAALLVATVLVVCANQAWAANARTRVYLNGEAITVSFSDGDTFRILEGPYAGANTRLAGFNTLESYGPAHYWGDWHPYELWINAKMATLSARRGVWHCTTDGERDGYGRLLAVCPDLGVSHIRQGYAHAMQVDDTPTRPEYLRAQAAAIRDRVGMWAHGVPPFVLTSLHSASEDPGREVHYNRRVSTRDGHSEKWGHHDTYEECQMVCATETVADVDRVEAMARELRADRTLAPLLEELEMPNILLIELVDRYARLGELPEYTDPRLAAAVGPRLQQARAQGALGTTHEERGGCMLYVDFLRRYGSDRAECLRGRGPDPR